ncbi:MAG: hypothetical protein V4574_15500 [Pseudomonadota bacterium]
MGTFEFVFSVFGLLLGFSLVEVLGGLARSFKARPRIHVGWLTPLLSIFVMLDLVGFWSIAWDAREVVPAGYGVLVIGLTIAGLYYFAAALIFPSELGADTDLDQYYLENKPKVLAIIVICQLLAHGARFALMGSAAYQWSMIGWINFSVCLLALAAAIFVRGYRWNCALLTINIAGYLIDAARHLH